MGGSRRRSRSPHLPRRRQQSLPAWAMRWFRRRPSTPAKPISGAQLQEVEVTNPNLTGDYAKSIRQVEGMISKRTLLPGRTISVSALREPFTVTRGSSIRLVFTLGAMTISAAGSPLEDGMTGQLIRVRNMDSGVIVSGTVLADGTIHVAAK